MKIWNSVLVGAAVAVLACGAAQAKGGSKGSTHASTHSSTASGSNHSVSGYTKKDGTYVAPHHATNPNDNKHDNYSTKGNTNPYTGKEGTVDPNKKP